MWIRHLNSRIGYGAGYLDRGASYPSNAAARGTANRVQAPIIDPSNPLILRAGAQRALKTLGFDASGNPIAISTTISPALAAFCASATLCLGKISAWPCRQAPYLMRELFRYLIHICYVSDPHLLLKDLK